MVLSLSSIGAALHQELEHARFEFEVGALRGTTLDVVRFEGEEAVSETFSFRIELRTDLPFEVVEPLLSGRNGELTVRGPDDARRLVRGVVGTVECLGEVAGDVSEGRAPTTRLTVELTPRLALLRRRRRDRIFRHQTVQQIVASILADWSIAASWVLLHAHPPRRRTVQRGESDYDFLRRILADEGIFFFFTFEPRTASALDGIEPSEMMVFGDAAQSYWAISPFAGQAEPITRALGRPTLGPLSSYPSELVSPCSGLALGTTLRVDRHRQDEDHAPDGGEERVLEFHILAEHGVEDEVGHGVTTCRGLIPGHTFFVADHASSRLDGGYVVTRLTSRGSSRALTSFAPGDLVYENEFEVISHDATFRPRRRARPQRATPIPFETCARDAGVLDR